MRARYQPTVGHWPPAGKCRGGHHNELDDESAAAADNSAEDMKWEAATSEMVRCNPGYDSNAHIQTNISTSGFASKKNDSRLCLK